MICSEGMMQNITLFRGSNCRGVSDVGFSIFADTDADFAF